MGMMNQPSALEHVLITTKVEKIINWSRATSVWPMTFGLACCAIEMMAAGAARFDFDRFGCGIFLFLLLFGYGYIWSKGALTWE